MIGLAERLSTVLAEKEAIVEKLVSDVEDGINMDMKKKRAAFH